MVIQMCQAPNLAELMTKMQKDFGPDAVLLAVRRVDMASNGTGFVVEGTIGVKRPVDPTFPAPVARPKLAAPPVLIQPKPEAVPAAKPYAAPVGRAVAPVAVKPVEKVVKPLSIFSQKPDPIPSAFPQKNAAPVIVEAPAILSPLSARPASAQLSTKSPREQQEEAKSNFLRQRVNTERARERTGGKFGTHSIALVGPMGAGKTTTTAKIAGRFRSLRKEPVGVVSTDTDRPGGSTLLMAYAQELQLHGTTATTAPELRDRMMRWSRRGPLVIDTRGCSPRDSLAIERMGEMFKTSGFEVERYLVLSATEHPLVARECLENFDELELNGVILTRVDQAAGIGHCLEEVRKSGLPIIFAGTGESVPQDLIEPTATTFRALEITAQAVLA